MGGWGGDEIGTFPGTFPGSVRGHFRSHACVLVREPGTAGVRLELRVDQYSIRDTRPWSRSTLCPSYVC
eukprot:3597144-Prymnesium_polylepis.1